MVQRVGEGALQDWEAVARQSRRNGSWTASPWAGEDIHRVRSEFWMGADLRALCEAGERAGWVLTVGTAIEFLRDRPVPTACIGSVWRPCQVTLFSERLHTATHQVEAVELQLDMSSSSLLALPRHRWLVMRGREPDERVSVSDLRRLCGGTGTLQADSR